MQQRYSYSTAGYEAMRGLEAYLRQCGLDTNLVHLMKLRASQINGCAFCINMHASDLRAAGESEQRVYCLDAWRECPFYTDRERAALAWTEALTLLSVDRVPDHVYDEVRRQFSEQEVGDLSIAVATINAWNRLAVSARTPPAVPFSRSS
jgi:AhpD family alkylhydroperoxidase